MPNTLRMVGFLRCVVSRRSPIVISTELYSYLRSPFRDLATYDSAVQVCALPPGCGEVALLQASQQFARTHYRLAVQLTLALTVRHATKRTSSAIPPARRTTSMGRSSASRAGFSRPSTPAFLALPDFSLSPGCILALAITSLFGPARGLWATRACCPTRGWFAKL